MKQKAMSGHKAEPSDMPTDRLRMRVWMDEQDRRLRAVVVKPRDDETTKENDDGDEK